jgi:hypothetical protein
MRLGPVLGAAFVSLAGNLVPGTTSGAPRFPGALPGVADALCGVPSASWMLGVVGYAALVSVASG